MEQLTKYAQEVIELLRKILLAVTPSKEKWTNVYESATINNTPDVISTQPTVLHGFYFYNDEVAPRSFKLFDKGSLPAMGVDRPKLNIVVAPNSGVQTWYPRGVHFTFGIGIAVTFNIGDYDNTPSTVGDVVANVYYE